jgi:hypothetical protein
MRLNRAGAVFVAAAPVPGYQRVAGGLDAPSRRPLAAMPAARATSTERSPAFDQPLMTSTGRTGEAPWYENSMGSAGTFDR